MAYQKFSLYFKWIYQIVYEIIANLFTHLNHCNFFSINFKKMVAKKVSSVYVERKGI